MHTATRALDAWCVVMTQRLTSHSHTPTCPSVDQPLYLFFLPPHHPPQLTMPYTSSLTLPSPLSLAPAQVFTGDASYPVEQFLSILDATWPLLPLPADEPRLSAAKIAYLAQHLRGRARLWFAEHLHHRASGMHGPHTYAQLRAHLLQVFGSELPLRAPRRASTIGPGDKEEHEAQENRQKIVDRMRAEQMFARLVQKTGVKEYGVAYEEASGKCGHKIDLDEEFECLWFVHGLKPAIRDEVLRVFQPGVKFANVVKEAERVEAELSAQ